MPSCSRCTNKGLRCEGRPSRRSSDAATRQAKKQPPSFKKSSDLYPLRSKDEPPFQGTPSKEAEDSQRVAPMLMDAVTSSPVQEPESIIIPDMWPPPPSVPLLPPGYDYALPHGEFA